MRNGWWIAVIGLVCACTPKAPPKPGAACTEEGASTCLDKTSRLICKSGTQRLQKCISCDQQTSGSSTSMTAIGCVFGGIGPEGAACDGKSFDCDGTTYVECIDGHYRRFPCEGPEHCTADAKLAYTCDSSVATPGTSCLEEKVWGCTPDKSGVAYCRDGKFVVGRSCAGPAGCTVDGDGLKCDSSLAVVGAPCKGGGACSKDRSTVLVCKDDAYAVMQRCRGEATGCQLVEGSISCSHPELGAVGDPCDEGDSSCSEDGKSFLQCKAGVFAVARKCRTCARTGNKINCK